MSHPTKNYSRTILHITIKFSAMIHKKMDLIICALNGVPLHALYGVPKGTQ